MSTLQYPLCGRDTRRDAIGRLDAEALPFQLEAFPRQPQQCDGLLPVASHWLIEADDDLGGLERAFGRGNRPA